MFKYKCPVCDRELELAVFIKYKVCPTCFQTHGDKTFMFHVEVGSKMSKFENDKLRACIAGEMRYCSSECKYYNIKNEGLCLKLNPHLRRLKDE